MLQPQPQPQPRPGIILVRSALKPNTNLSAHGFDQWYERKHIPDVLATGGVCATARYRLLVTFPPQTDEVRRLPNLAVYYLRDMDWLHEEGCGFWRVPLVLGSESEDAGVEGGGGEGRNVFEVAEFETGFWEVVESVDGEGCHGLDKEEGPATLLLLLLMDSDDVEGESGKELVRSSLLDLSVQLGIKPARSMLFRLDASRPGPPSPTKANEDSDPPLESTGTKYLCLHEIRGPDAVIGIPLVTSPETRHYALQSAFGKLGDWYTAE